jgi:hypothetical protein
MLISGMLADFLLRAGDILIEDVELAFALSYFLLQFFNFLLVVLKGKLRYLKLMLTVAKFLRVPFCLATELGELH